MQYRYLFLRETFLIVIDSTFSFIVLYFWEVARVGFRSVYEAIILL